MEFVRDEKLGAWSTVGTEHHIIGVDATEVGFACYVVGDELVDGQCLVRLFPPCDAGAE